MGTTITSLIERALPHRFWHWEAFQQCLDGKQILVVEDELLQALELADLLEDLGCFVWGPTGDLFEANRLAHHCPLDGAVLDVRLHNHETAAPLASLLRGQGVPFFLVTAFCADLPPELRDVAYLIKHLAKMQFWKLAVSEFGGAARQ